LYNWYRNYLSDFKTEIKEGTWNDKKVYIVNQQTAEIHSEQTVYIAEPQNIGKKMNIDDKQIGNESYTIMSNQETGKIAFLMDSTKYDELKRGFEFLGKDIKNIEHISCDMAASYLKFCNEVLPQSEVSIDKFHVMKYVYEALGDVRKRIRKEVIAKMPKGKRKQSDDIFLSELELIKKTRRILNQSSEKWSQTQLEIMKLVFEKYPELKLAYDLSQSFKHWYNKGNSKYSKLQNEIALIKWYDKVEQSNIKEFEPCLKMIQKHEQNILNYFSVTLTNARAENLNGKIQRFISNNFGVRDKDFFLYRVKKYFA